MDWLGRNPLSVTNIHNHYNWRNMRKRLRLLAVACTALVITAPVAKAQDTPVVAKNPPFATLKTPLKWLSDPTRKIPASANCPRWWPVALQAGWQWKDLTTLDRIIHRESRCQPTAHNTTLNVNGSTDMGLTQINDRSWCLPSRYYKKGYLQSLGIIEYCEDLFDPLTNLIAAKALYDYSKENGSGFRPWNL